MVIYYSHKRKRFEAASRYEDRFVFRNAGWRWDPDQRCWWTDDLRKAAALRSYADESAIAVLKEAEEEKNFFLQLSKADDAHLDYTPPPGLHLYGFQRAGIVYCLEALKERKGVILGDEMGLGKTVQALVVADLLGAKRILVVCPASLKINWAREAQKWLPSMTVEVGGGTSWKTVPENGMYIVNYDVLKTLKVEGTLDLLILDEAHYIKNRSALRSRLALKLARQASKVLMLTGTPIANRPAELFNLLRIADRKQFSDFLAYAKRYCDAKQSRWGWDFSGASNLEELSLRLRSGLMVRRLKKDVLDLPAKVRQVVLLDSSNFTSLLHEEQAFAHLAETIEELSFKATLADLEDDIESFKSFLSGLRAAQARFEEMSTLRRKLAVAKAPFIIEHIKDILEQEECVVVFAHHKDLIARLREAFPKSVTLTGESSAEERQQAVDAFQRGLASVFIGSITAAGVGITLTRARTAVFAEIDWVPANLQQAEDRLHRIGQRGSVLIHYVVVDGSIEARVAQKIAAKLDVIERAVDHTAESLSPLDLEELNSAFSAAYSTREARRLELLPVEDAASRRLVGEALTVIAGLDPDRARQRNGLGFSRWDSRMGHALATKAASGLLTPRQAAYGLILAWRYRRQLPENLKQSILKLKKLYAEAETQSC